MHRWHGHLLPMNYPWSQWPELTEQAVPEFRRRVEYSEMNIAFLAIIQSVSASGLSDQFVASWSPLGRLSVALAAFEPTLREEITVRGDMPLHWVSPGSIRIYHESYSGMVDDIESPIVDAVPLFWRFVAEKFGIYYAL
jgi:hypothetical protein